MKLITALCDALGFDVKVVCVNQDNIDMQNINIKNEFRDLSMWSVFDSKVRVNLITPIYNYKLTKSVDKVKTVEKPFTKLKENDEIFNTEMFGEVRVSRDFEHGTRIDTKKGGEYFTAFVEDHIYITYMIKVIDNMYSARGKA
tara:strand:- start:235 stop:663 length:429 start_codon:yes stop_codon:yes gene_type:complete